MDVDAREQRVGFLRGGCPLSILQRGMPPLHQLKDLGSSVSSPSEVWGGGPSAYGFLTFYSCQINSPASEHEMYFLLTCQTLF